MRDFIAVTKALSDENRVRALMALAGGELCVCQIIALLGLAPSTVSKHMAVLQQAGLVRVRRGGRWRYYRLPGRDATGPVRRALRWMLDALEEDETVAADAEKLEKKVKRMPVGECCAN